MGVILLLLVLSGDVEINPGPVGEFLVLYFVYANATSRKVICEQWSYLSGLEVYRVDPLNDSEYSW